MKPTGPIGTCCIGAFVCVVGLVANVGLHSPAGYAGAVSCKS